MKNATFRKIYETETKFDGNDLAQMFNSEHITQVNRSQRENVQQRNDDRTLIEIFDQDGYELKYLGNGIGAAHEFEITNGIKTINLQMNDELFRTYFNVM